MDVLVVGGNVDVAVTLALCLTAMVTTLLYALYMRSGGRTHNSQAGRMHRACRGGLCMASRKRHEEHVACGAQQEEL
jgi:hypothetical protein